MDRWKYGLLAALAALTKGFALVEEEIDEKHPLEAVFSSSSHNRISVEGGAVEKVFADSALFSVSIDSGTGNAFVNVLRAIEKPATLTVVTSAGPVQDLLIASSDGPSEQVVLQEQEEIDPAVYGGGVSHAPTVELLNQILEGKIPFGYGQREAPEGAALKLPEPMEAKLLKAFEGPFESIDVYELENRGEAPVVVSPDALKKEGVSWVFLNGHELARGQRILCLIGHPKEN